MCAKPPHVVETRLANLATDQLVTLGHGGEEAQTTTIVDSVHSFPATVVAEALADVLERFVTAVLGLDAQLGVALGELSEHGLRAAPQHRSGENSIEPMRTEGETERARHEHHWHPAPEQHRRSQDSIEAMQREQAACVPG